MPLPLPEARYDDDGGETHIKIRIPLTFIYFIVGMCVLAYIISQIVIVR